MLWKWVISGWTLQKTYAVSSQCKSMGKSVLWHKLASKPLSFKTFSWDHESLVELELFGSNQQILIIPQIMQGKKIRNILLMPRRGNLGKESKLEEEGGWVRQIKYKKKVFVTHQDIRIKVWWNTNSIRKPSRTTQMEKQNVNAHTLHTFSSFLIALDSWWISVQTHCRKRWICYPANYTGDPKQNNLNNRKAELINMVVECLATCTQSPCPRCCFQSASRDSIYGNLVGQ